MGLESNEQSSSHKAFFEIELVPLDLNMVSELSNNTQLSQML